jgi:hypothetical protein
MSEELETKTWVLTCETEGCFNKDLGIELETSAEYFICGVCSNQITNSTIK